MVLLLGLEGDDGGGVVPLAVLQQVRVGPDIAGDNMAIAIMPVYLK